MSTKNGNNGPWYISPKQLAWTVDAFLIIQLTDLLITIDNVDKIRQWKQTAFSGWHDCFSESTRKQTLVHLPLIDVATCFRLE